MHPCCCKWQNFILLYGWVVFHCTYTSHLLYPFVYQWTLRLRPHIANCCYLYCSEHWDMCIFLKWWYCLFHVYTQEWELLGHMVVLFLVFWETSMLFCIVKDSLFLMHSMLICTGKVRFLTVIFWDHCFSPLKHSFCHSYLLVFGRAMVLEGSIWREVEFGLYLAQYKWDYIYMTWVTWSTLASCLFLPILPT